MVAVEKKLRRHCAKQRLMITMFDEILRWVTALSYGISSPMKHFFTMIHFTYVIASLQLWTFIYGKKLWQTLEKYWITNMYKYWVYVFYFSIQYGLSFCLFICSISLFLSFLSKLTKKILWSTCMYYYQPFVSRIYTHIEIGFIFSIENIFSILIKKL